MRSVGIPELLVIWGIGIIVLLLPAVAVAAIVWFVLRRRPSVTPGSRTCAHCRQRIPDIGSFCAFCGQKIA